MIFGLSDGLAVMSCGFLLGVSVYCVCYGLHMIRRTMAVTVGFNDV